MDNIGRVTKRSIVFLISFLLAVYPLGGFVSAATVPITNENVIITFKSTVDPKVIQAVKTYKGKVKRQAKKLKSVSATLPSNAVNMIKSYSSVKTVEKDNVMKIKGQVQDWGIEKTKAPTSWAMRYTGTGIKVAVLDTGIAPHSDLQLAGGVSFVSYTTSYADDNGHGTHVAGIIGARNNDIGTIGVAPEADLYAVKVMDSNGSGMLSDIIFGIDWAVANHMDVINMSLGTQSDSVALKDAVARAVNSGITVVAAAGNDGNATATGDTVDYPARYDGVIAVAATDINNAKASFSSAGPAVDIAAPGVSIYSTIRTGGYGYMQGTSMASPYVAGVVALYKQAYPNYTSAQIETLLKENAVDLGAVGKDNVFGYGLVQAPTTEGTANIPVAPNAPLTFKTGEITTKSIALSWSPVEGATKYELKRNGVVIYTGTNLSFVDSNLTQGTSYTYTLTAKNIGGTSTPASLTAKTKLPALLTPTGFRATVGSDQVKLTWSKVTGATKYILKRDGVVVYEGSDVLFVDKQVTSATTYQYELISANDNGISNPSIVKATTTPTTPLNLRETHGSLDATLTWDSVPGATYYTIKNSKSGTVIYKGTATSFRISSLLAGYTYGYSVYAGNAGGLSQPSSISFTTIPVAPTKPTITAIRATQTNVTLAWKAIYNAKSYEVKRNGVVVYSGTALTFTDIGLTPGGTYRYEVKAKNEVGDSQVAEIVKQTLPAVPTNVKATSTTNSVTLKWDAAQGASSYVVKRNGTVIYKGTATSIINSGLLAGTEYQYTVTAVNASGSSPSTSILKIKTVQAIPTAPLVTKMYLTKSSVTVYWKSVYNAKSYTVKRNGVVVYTGIKLTFIDAGTLPGQLYNYSVTATNEAGTSIQPTITIRTPY